MSGWTTVDELVDKLQRRWDRGQFLRAHAADEPFEPVSLPVRGPKPSDVLDDLDAVRRWVERLAHDASKRGLEVEHRTLRSRQVGDNRVPARVVASSLRRLERAVERTGETETLDHLLEETGAAVPELAGWVARHPREAIAYADVWERMLATVAWIDEHDVSTLDVRHVDVPGVDSKFVERHARLLRQLLTEVLPTERVDADGKRFGDRFGFRPRPTYVRFRLLQPVPLLPDPLTELEVRTDELAAVELPVSTVFVIENRASFLAFPAVPAAMAIFGEGFGVTVLEHVPWLATRELVYWGDIDTHGFTIVQRLRERLPAARTILMDHATLTSHLDHLVTEAQPTSESLPLLTREEQSVYRDLVEDRLGQAVRLEQESVRFSAVRAALAPWVDRAR